MVDYTATVTDYGHCHAPSIRKLHFMVNKSIDVGKRYRDIVVPVLSEPGSWRWFKTRTNASIFPDIQEIQERNTKPALTFLHSHDKTKNVLFNPYSSCRL